ncbi:MAG: zinc-binding dehydrogenase [Halieaceae bacterium]|nr:zinc-binding dehydrogenase [Halieaceae bacterium]
MTNMQSQLRSIINDDLTLEVSLINEAIPVPGPEEVLVEIQAAPINPSDLFLLLGPVDPESIRIEKQSESPVVLGKIFEKARGMIDGRIGQSMVVGNEGAGLIVDAGKSDIAQALKGRMVGVFGGGMYTQYRCLNVNQCLPLLEGTTAEQGASCFVNPMTALGMVETMRMEGHAALVHTAAASNLGQMLNQVCLSDGIGLTNIVRSSEQVAMLEKQGSVYTIDSSQENFQTELTKAITETGATLGFDAVGGGKLASQILNCMEISEQSKIAGYSAYGSNIYKQIYIYGGLDMSPTTLNRNFGLSWGVGGWLLMPFMMRAGQEIVSKMKKKVASELTTTFASNYASKVSLTEALSLDTIIKSSKRATGEKILITPQK